MKSGQTAQMHMFICIFFQSEEFEGPSTSKMSPVKSGQIAQMHMFICQSLRRANMTKCRFFSLQFNYICAYTKSEGQYQ